MKRDITPDETRAWFAVHMKRRSDYGLGNAVLSFMFHPRNPFSPKQRRKFKAGFLFAVAWIGTAIALLVLFNFSLGRF
jgi:hypothetical protein